MQQASLAFSWLALTKCFSLFVPIVITSVSSLPLLPIVCIQITFFVLCAAAHGTAFLRWKKWSAEQKKGSWPMYGWFTAISCIGSAAGALAFAARVAQFAYRYPRQRLEQLTNRTIEDDKWVSGFREFEIRSTSAFFILFPIEAWFTTVAQLLMLYRIFRFSLSGSRRKRAWWMCSRIFFAVVNAVHLSGVLCNITAATYLIEGADVSRKVVNAYVDNNIVSAKKYEVLALSVIGKGASLLGIQRFLEAVVLIIVITAFLVTGFNCHRIIMSALRALFSAEQKVSIISGAAASQARDLVHQAGSEGKLLHRKVVGTVLVVFATVLLRSFYSILYALALYFNQISNPCSRSECDPCKNVFSHILSWMLYTPFFEQGIMLVASPLAQLVALWGMSGVRAIEQMTVEQIHLSPNQKSGANSRL